MKSNKKVISAILVALLIAICVFMLCACGETSTGKTAQHKKAIVICTALISGGLYDTETGESIWDPISEDAYFQQVMAGGDMVGLVLSVLTDGGTYDLLSSILNYADEGNYNALYQLMLDADGNSTNPNLRPANVYKTTADGSITFDLDGTTLEGYGSYTGDSKIQYGALAAYRQQCLDLQQRYGEDWDVTVFNYDWRIDNRKNSELLDNFIETNGWDQVVLTSHSMGGPVVAGYISRLYNKYIEETGNSNEAVKKINEKILAYRAFSPATAGSVQAIYFLDNPVGACYDAVNGAVGDTIGGVVESIEALKEGLAVLAAPLVQNMTSVMQLLPFQQFIDSEYYGTNESCVYVDGEPVTNIYEWYCSRPWAHREDWDPSVDGIYDKLKYGMETLPDYWASFYVDYDSDNDGIMDTNVYSPELINTTYCIGVGYNTYKSVQITTVGTDSLNVNKVYYKPGANNKGMVLTTDESESTMFSYSYDIKQIIFADGDGTMPTHACIGGQDIDYTTMTTKSIDHKSSDAVFSIINDEKVDLNCIQLLSNSRKVVCYDPADHGMVGCDWELLKYDFYDMVDSMIADRIKNGKYIAR